LLFLHQKKRPLRPGDSKFFLSPPPRVSGMTLEFSACLASASRYTPLGDVRTLLPGSDLGKCSVLFFPLKLLLCFLDPFFITVLLSVFPIIVPFSPSPGLREAELATPQARFLSGLSAGPLRPKKRMIFVEGSFVFFLPTFGALFLFHISHFNRASPDGTADHPPSIHWLVPAQPRICTFPTIFVTLSIHFYAPYSCPTEIPHCDTQTVGVLLFTPLPFPDVLLPERASPFFLG